MILAVSAPEDRHVAAVVDLLTERDIRVAHVEAPSLSADTAVEFDDGRWLLHLKGRRESIDLSAARIGWWRRDPMPPISRDVAVLAEADGAPVESTEALVGTLLALDVEWVSAPHDDRVARWRPVQWRAAVRAGIPLPATLVTRDPDRARAFRDRHLDAGVIVKPLVRRDDDGCGCRQVPSERELEEVVTATIAESVVQRFIPGDDIRVIAIGTELFAAELDPGSAAWYAEPEARPIALPTALHVAIHRMLSMLGLGAAAVDLRRDLDGGYWLLDIDPQPRWLLLEELTGLPVTQAMVELLSRNAHALSLI
ncbi:MAG: hypothetical protein HY996_02965 [Micrococcales bacterium]|nr:hypothetical protein [Micrococcales bacterium]